MRTEKPQEHLDCGTILQILAQRDAYQAFASETSLRVFEAWIGKREPAELRALELYDNTVEHYLKKLRSETP